MLFNLFTSGHNFEMLLFLLINVFNFVSHFAFIIDTPLFAIMKTKKLLLLIAFIATMFTAFSAGGTQANEIIITGSSGTPNGPPCVPAASSLEAYLDLDVITVYFLNDLGNVTIAITDEWGAVVQQTIEPSACGNTAVIDISGLESGSYTITFRNEGSFHKCGEFEL